LKESAREATAGHDSSKRWYAIRTYSGHENKVKAHIENEARHANLTERIITVMVPSEKIFEVKEGKKKSRTKTFFPGYILVEAVLDKETKHLILNSPSVISFVGPRGEPAPLQYDEVRRLVGRMEERKNVEVMEIPFRVGDAVKVIDGPFNNFTGFVQEVNEEKMKLKVMVSIFGRKTPVELDFNQVELEK
jgi:transcription termination/antitermination protein NusG